MDLLDGRRQVFFGEPLGDLLVAVAVFDAHIAAGFLARSWWVLFVPYSLVLASYPLGYPSANRGEPSEIWRGLFAWSPMLLVVAAYVAVVGILLAYAATLDVEDSFVAGTVAFLVLQVLVGLVLGRWRALFLVAILPILAIPVPTPEDAREPIPLWFGMLIFTPLIAGLIAAGVGARKVWNRWRSLVVA